MTTAERPCEEIAMDFVVEILEPEAYYTSLAVTDQLNKVLQYILAKTTWTAADITNTYIN